MPSPPADPRVLLFSKRRIAQPLWQAGQYEFEDVIAGVEQVDLVAPAGRIPSTWAGWRNRLANKARRTLGARRLAPFPGEAVSEEVEVRGNYELFFSVIHAPWQVVYLRQLKDWRSRCRVAVCLLMEAWTPHLEYDRDFLSALADFNHVFVFNAAVAGPLAELTGRPCSFLPLGLDTLAFSSYPRPPRRTIEWYSYGRRSPQIHAKLLQLAEERRALYLYDTTRTSQGNLIEPREHRQLLTNLLKRSNFVFVHRINESVDRATRTGGDEGLSTRYFEGAAGGAVLLGSAPTSPEYAQWFDWPDATVPIDFAGADLVEVLHELEADPARLARARCHNLTNSLRRNDAAHRWRDVLSVAGLEPSEALEARCHRLEDVATLVEADLGSVTGRSAPAELPPA
jgi:hypothetical protein